MPPVLIRDSVLSVIHFSYTCCGTQVLSCTFCGTNKYLVIREVSTGIGRSKPQFSNDIRSFH